jgi:hypothetical protein
MLESMSSSLRQQQWHQNQSLTTSRIHIGHFGRRVEERERLEELALNPARVLSDLSVEWTSVGLAGCYSLVALLRVRELLQRVSMHEFPIGPLDRCPTNPRLEFGNIACMKAGFLCSLDILTLNLRFHAVTAIRTLSVAPGFPVPT